MPKYRSLFSITVPVTLWCSVEVEAFNEDIAEDIANTLAKHLLMESDIFRLQCPRTGIVAQGAVVVNENYDMNIGHISIDEPGD